MLVIGQSHRMYCWTRLVRLYWKSPVLSTEGGREGGANITVVFTHECFGVSSSTYRILVTFSMNAPRAPNVKIVTVYCIVCTRVSDALM